METTEISGAGGIRLVADVAGHPAEPPVLLTHGGGQTRHAWGNALAVLAGAGWRAHSIDLRGHGESDWAPDGDYRLDAFAADVVAVAEHLEEPPVLAGASLGGLASLVAVGELGLAARALALVDVAPRMESEGVERIGAFMTEHLETGFGSLEEVADAVAAYNPHRPRPDDLDGLRKNLRRRDDGRWVWHWDPAFVSGRLGAPDETRTSMIDPRRLEDAAAALDLPVLVIRGRVSDLLSEQGARELLEMVPGARLVDVAGAGHMVAGDRNDLFNTALTEFLGDLR